MREVKIFTGEISLSSGKVSFRNLRKVFVGAIRRAAPEIKISIEPKRKTNNMMRAPENSVTLP